MIRAEHAHAILASRGLGCQRMREEPAAERRVRSRTDAEHLPVYPRPPGQRQCETNERAPYLERGEHLALLLAIHETVVVLHGHERREAVRDRIICRVAP